MNARIEWRSPFSNIRKQDREGDTFTSVYQCVANGHIKKGPYSIDLELALDNKGFATTYASISRLAPREGYAYKYFGDCRIVLREKALHNGHTTGFGLTQAIEVAQEFANAFNPSVYDEEFAQRLEDLERRGKKYCDAGHKPSHPEFAVA